jgi:uncharacterized protein
MEISDSFALPVDADRLWRVLTDVELIAPSVRGFRLTHASDPEYRGAMKIRLGAIAVEYDVTLSFVERDPVARRAVLSMAGKEVKGGGTANATMTATISGNERHATAEMVTDVEVTGRVAQFGRGIVADVASTLTKAFVDDLTPRVLNESAVSQRAVSDDARPDGEQVGSGPGAIEAGAQPADEVLDLGAIARSPILKRLAPLGIVVVVVAALVIRKRRH